MSNYDDKDVIRVLAEVGFYHPMSVAERVAAIRGPITAAFPELEMPQLERCWLHSGVHKPTSQARH